jgi:alcohol dehydrogenase (cytochrome c)
MRNNSKREVRQLADKRRRGLSSLFVFACLTAVSAPLFSFGYAQSTVNQPGTMMDVRTQDLEAAAIQNNWLSYHGDNTGRRYTTLAQVTRGNVSQLQLQWVFHSRNASLVGAAPIVVGGIMYVVASNDTFAIDARTGAMLWRYTRKGSASSSESEATHASRGVAVLGSNLYVVTEDAHLICLDARSGSLVWDIPYTGGNRDSGAASSPLVVHDKIIVAVSGSRDGVSGFIAAFNVADGKEAWRFRIDALPIDNNSSNQPKASRLHCGSAMWMQGTYDPDQHAIYWMTGYSTSFHEASAQLGEDQTSACLWALDAESGRLKWSTRFMPQGHCGDDAPQTPVLMSTTYEGAQRSLIVEANRYGFPLLFDRETGILLGASEKPCQGSPEAEGWYAPSYSEQTHLFYSLSEEALNVRPAGNRSGPEAIRKLPGNKKTTAATSQNVLVAYNPAAMTIAWKSSRIGANSAPSGSLATSTGVLFFADGSPFFKAVDAASGKMLWQFNMGQNAGSPPVGFAIGERQYVVVAAGMDLFAFRLP